MGACSSKTVRDVPCMAYAQTHSRSQVHEVAVVPLTKANFPSPTVPAFQRLHEIYETCPRVRQHFASSDEALPIDAFYKQVVVEASNPCIPDGCVVPVLVVTRWRGDEAWDVAGYVGCRSYDSEGRRTETSALQMFFKDGHKVPLTMPAIQLAARLFIETHALAQADEAAAANGGVPVKPSSPLFASGSTRAPWPRDVEWTIRRHNMEVRRVLEAVLVFWGLRPARTGTPDQPAPSATLFGPGAGAGPMHIPPPHHHQQVPPGYGAAPPYPGQQQQHRSPQSMQDAAPYLASFPLEIRSATADLVTLGSAQFDAISSLMADLAGWSSASSSAQQWHADPSALEMGALLPGDFTQRGGRMLVTGLSMNFRGTQQKTPVERRDVLGTHVADALEMIQPAPRDPAEQAAIDRAHQSRREQRRSTKPALANPPPSYGSVAPTAPLQHHQHHQHTGFGGGVMHHQFAAQPQMVPMMHMQQPQHQPRQQHQQALQLPSSPAPPGYTYAFMQGGDGNLVPILIPSQQQLPQQQQQQQPQQSFSNFQPQQHQQQFQPLEFGAPQSMHQHQSPSVFGSKVTPSFTQQYHQQHDHQPTWIQQAPPQGAFLPMAY